MKAVCGPQSRPRQRSHRRRICLVAAAEFPPPPAQSSDWWLSLPVDCGAGPPDSSTKAANDLTDGSGRRVIELKGLKIAVGADKLNNLATRPAADSADVAETCTIIHASGAVIAVKKGEMNRYRRGAENHFVVLGRHHDRWIADHDLGQWQIGDRIGGKHALAEYSPTARPSPALMAVRNRRLRATISALAQNVTIGGHKPILAGAMVTGFTPALGCTRTVIPPPPGPPVPLPASASRCRRPRDRR